MVKRERVSTVLFVLDSDLSLGNKLLVYISCCLAGQAYPVGTIPEDFVQDVKKEVGRLCPTTVKRSSLLEPLFTYTLCFFYKVEARWSSG